jgi:SSS family solute:Na+ symporter
LRFVLEVLDKGSHFDGAAVRWLLDMNFLHYAILMFVICCGVLVLVSLLTPAPERRKLAGLTFATVDDKIDTQQVGVTKVALARESPFEHKLNVAFSLLLLASVVGLWIWFR